MEFKSEIDTEYFLMSQSCHLSGFNHFDEDEYFSDSLFAVIYIVTQQPGFQGLGKE